MNHSVNYNKQLWLISSDPVCQASGIRLRIKEATTLPLCGWSHYISAYMCKKEIKHKNAHKVPTHVKQMVREIKNPSPECSKCRGNLCLKDRRSHCKVKLEFHGFYERTPPCGIIPSQLYLNRDRNTTKGISWVYSRTGLLVCHYKVKEHQVIPFAVWILSSQLFISELVISQG